MALIFGFVALLLTAADCYIVFGVLANTPWLTKCWLFLPTLIYWAVIIRQALSKEIRQMTLNAIMWLTMCVAIPTLAFTLFSLLGLECGLIWRPLYSILSWIGVGVAGMWVIMALYGSIFGWRRLVVKPTDIHLSDLPDNFEGYKIAQLTDFHIGVYASHPEAVAKIVEKVNSLHPDLIVFTGDLINTSPKEVGPFSQVLSRLDAPDGVISILGNHDYGIYNRYKGDDSPHKALERIIQAEEEMGWTLLRNQSVQITRDGESIAIVGVENAGDRHFPNRADLKKALEGLPKEECKILLSHDPSHWSREVLPATDIPLTLAGHTHAMQFRIGKFSPSKWSYPQWGGRYKEGNQQLYVSTGIGGNIAFRFGVYPTIDLLTLQK